MPKAIIDWNSKRRRFPYMCEVCGKKYGDKKQAKTCEWADMNGTNRKAAYQNKKAKERDGASGHVHDVSCRQHLSN